MLIVTALFVLRTYLSSNCTFIILISSRLSHGNEETKKWKWRRMNRQVDGDGWMNKRPVRLFKVDLLLSCLAG
jgi:hypothetical protein